MHKYRAFAVAAAICRHATRRIRTNPRIMAQTTRTRKTPRFPRRRCVYAMPRGGVDAAATDVPNLPFLAILRFRYAMPMAAGCRRYGRTQSPVPHGLTLPIRNSPWRQVAAVADEHNLPFLTVLRFRYATPMAAGCRRYGRTQSSVPHGLTLPIRNSPWWQVAAAADVPNLPFLTDLRFL